jgi:hypothetical protein
VKRWSHFERQRRDALRRLLEHRGRSVLGLCAAVTIVVLVNAFGARFDRRWDFTEGHRYTPGAALRSILVGLPVDVTAIVLLSHSDPLSPTVGQLLESYRSYTHHLQIEWIDPERDPVRFLSRQTELGMKAGHSEDDRPTSDAVLVFVSRGRRYYVEPEEILGLDPEPTDSTSHFEHAVAVALRTLLDRSSPTVCFTTGHRELSLTDRSPVGLSLLKERLERDTVVTRTVDLAASPPESLEGCRLVIVAAPDVPLSPFARRRLTEASADESLLLLGGIVPDSEGRLSSVGIESLAELGGIAIGRDVVLEMDDAFRLPNLFGETFLATPSEHAVTRGLLRGQSDAPLRVVVSLAPSLKELPNSSARPLLSSSSNSVTLSDVSQSAIAQVETSPTAGTKSHVVAMAGPVAGARGEDRRIAVAPVNVVQNRSFETPTLLVTQAFGMSLISWLLATQAATVEMDPRVGRSAMVELSAQELTEIARYTTLVMPGSFLLAGLGTWLIRRRRPNRDVERKREVPN